LLRELRLQLVEPPPQLEHREPAVGVAAQRHRAEGLLGDEERRALRVEREHHRRLRGVGWWTVGPRVPRLEAAELDTASARRFRLV
jgi:hypothetical protein